MCLTVRFVALGPSSSEPPLLILLVLWFSRDLFLHHVRRWSQQHPLSMLMIHTHRSWTQHHDSKTINVRYGAIQALISLAEKYSVPIKASIESSIIFAISYPMNKCKRSTYKALKTVKSRWKQLLKRGAVTLKQQAPAIILKMEENRSNGKVSWLKTNEKHMCTHGHTLLCSECLIMQYEMNFSFYIFMEMDWFTEYDR